jgi:hypothetical protein
MEIPTRSTRIRERLCECIHNGEVKNEDLVKIIEHSFKILNLQTLSDYSRNTKKSYNGAKYNKNVVVLGNVKFIIDNE